MLLIPAQQFRWASQPLPPLRGQGSFSTSPNGRGSLNTDDIRQTQFGEPFSKLAIIAIGGISQHGRRCNSLFYCLTNLLECDRRLGGKRNLVWNARLLAPFTILSPSLWQVQTPRDRETDLFSGHR